MTTNMLASATSLSNRDLLARLPQLAAHERSASAELVAHLVALDMRPDVYAAEGYGSLFGYCTRALQLSEDAACTRIAAVSACRRFPRILELLVSGELSLTAVRRIGPHLTVENCESVLARAVTRTRSDIDVLVAELAPRPDVAPSVRKVPLRNMQTPSSESQPLGALFITPVLMAGAAAGVPDLPSPAAPDAPRGPVETTTSVCALPRRPPSRPVIQPSAPERYRVQFTIGAETHAKLRRIQALLRREIPSGDPGVIFDQALSLLLDKVEKAKLGKAAGPSKRTAIRSGTDNRTGLDQAAVRYIPREVKRAVCDRDGGRCAFVSPSGHRCTERAYLEFHHIVPHALGGPASVENIALRCRRHNQYEAHLVFGSHGPSSSAESRATYAVAPIPRGIARPCLAPSP